MKKRMFYFGVLLVVLGVLMVGGSFLSEETRHVMGEALVLFGVSALIVAFLGWFLGWSGYDPH